MGKSSLDYRTEIIADHYGLDSRLNLLQEECSELIQAISKRRRKKEDNIIEELADVKLVIKQVEYLMHCHSDIKDVIEQKVQRTLGEIKNETDKDN